MNEQSLIQEFESLTHKTYSQLDGDGGSQIVDQVAARTHLMGEKLAGVKYLVAIASGKGGVGKSTLSALVAEGLGQNHKVALLDLDFNGPSLSRMFAIEGQSLIPGQNGLEIPRSKSGIGVLSLGSLVPEGHSVEFNGEGIDAGTEDSSDSHVWRSTVEFTALSEILTGTHWGELDYLILDLPPGAERCYQYAKFFGKRLQFLLVTAPSALSRGVVSRSVSSLQKAGAEVLGYVENMAGYLCPDCSEIKPLFPESGASILELDRLARLPFMPGVAQALDSGKYVPGLIPPGVEKELEGLLNKILLKTLHTKETP